MGSVLRVWISTSPFSSLTFSSLIETCQHRSARASLVDAASIATQPSMHDALCTRPPPAYTVALNARCPLFARKFPNDTASEVLKLFGDCTRRLYILTDECSS